MTGILYVIGTPIGNLEDVTLRAIKTLDMVEILYAEDTRVIAKLVNRLRETEQITNRPIYRSYNDFNESAHTSQIVSEVESGRLVGLVSDAGMPTIADPGYRAIRACITAGLKVEVIPGVSALTAALSWSAIGGNQHYFVGFLPQKLGKRKKQLTMIAELLDTTKSLKVVLYVSVHKMEREIAEMVEIIGDCHAVLMREISKIHEERIEGTLQSILDYTKSKRARGEVVLILSKELKQ